MAVFLVACDAGPQQAAPTGAQAPKPGDTFAVLATYQDPNNKFRIDAPASWRSQPQRLSQENMKAATAFVGPEGFISVAQFDWNTIPSEQATQLIDSFLQVTGVTSNKNYKELARLPVSATQVWVEMEYINAQNRPLHTLAQLRIDGSRISLISVSMNQDAWPRAVEISKQIINSYVLLDNKGG
jgi:hypothetical protein